MLKLLKRRIQVKRTKLLTLVGSICLVSALATLSFMPACAPAAIPGTTELEERITALESDKAALEDEITELRAPAKVYKWRLQQSDVPGSIQYTGFETTCELISETTNGQLEIEVYPAGTLVGTFEAFDAIATGVLEAAGLNLSYFSGIVPLSDLSMHVYSLESVDQFAYLYYEMGLEELWREAYLEHDIYLVGTRVAGCEWGGFMATTPIRTLDDFKGKTMRSFGIAAKTFEAFGCSVITIPGEEIYTALATGLLDLSCWGTAANYMEISAPEIAKYFILPQTTVCIDGFLASPTAFNALPDNVKTIVHSANRAGSYQETTLYKYRDAVATKTMIEDYGVEFITLSSDDVAQMRKTAWGFWNEAGAVDEYTARALAMTAEAMETFGIATD